MKKYNDVRDMSNEQLQGELDRCRGDYRYNLHFGENSEPRVRAKELKGEMRRRGLADIVMSMIVPGRGRHKTGRNF